MLKATSPHLRRLMQCKLQSPTLIGIWLCNSEPLDPDSSEVKKSALQNSTACRLSLVVIWSFFTLSSLLIHIYSFGIMKPKHTWCQQPVPRVPVSPPVVSRMEAFEEITIFEDVKLLQPIAQENLVLWRASSGSFQHLPSPQPIVGSSPIMDYLAQQGAVLPSYLPPFSCLCPETYLDMLHALTSQREATSKRVRLISKSGVYMSPHDTRSHRAKTALINDESTSLPVKSSI